jgi:hypothetical protein
MARVVLVVLMQVVLVQVVLVQALQGSMAAWSCRVARRGDTAA